MAKEKKPKSRLRWFMWGVVALCGAIALLAWGVLQHVENRLQKMKRVGDPVYAVDLAAERAIEVDTNAAFVLMKASDDAQSVLRRLSGLLESPSYRQGRLSDRDVADIQKAFADHPRMLPTIERALQCEEYLPLHNYGQGAIRLAASISDSCYRIETVGSMLLTSARLNHALGKPELAMQRVLDHLRLCAFFDNEPTFAGYLATMNARIEGLLAANIVLDHEVPLPLKQQLDEALGRSDLQETYRRAWKSQRTLKNTAYRDYVAVTTIWRRPLAARQHLQYLNLFRQGIDFVDRPHDRLGEEMFEPRANVLFRPQSPLLLPMIKTIHRRYCELRARTACTRIRLRLKSDGPLEPGWTGTATEALKSAGDDRFESLPISQLTDPFDGGPLSASLTDKGWEVTSKHLD